jgi:hypothetical protein
LETLDYLFLFDRMQLHLRIAPCLLSRVSALPEASLRAHILRVLGRSVGFPVTHEQIVDEMVREHVSTCVAVARRILGGKPKCSNSSHTSSRKFRVNLKRSASASRSGRKPITISLERLSILQMHGDPMSIAWIVWPWLSGFRLM